MDDITSKTLEHIEVPFSLISERNKKTKSMLDIIEKLNYQKQQGVEQK